MRKIKERNDEIINYMKNKRNETNHQAKSVFKMEE